MRIGVMLVAIAAVQIVLSLVLYHDELAYLAGESLASMLREHGDRGVALWFLVGGVAISVLGSCTLYIERHTLPLPRPLGLGLLALAVSVLLPTHLEMAAWMLVPMLVCAVRRPPRLAGLAKRFPARYQVHSRG
jgi:hypothetical protein